MRKQQKFRPAQMVEPIQPTAIDYEADGILIAGIFNPGRTRLRGDHPAVQANPALFRPIDPEDPDEGK